MGMTVLYIAFGIVALWLLAEVLMQYKARLRWRLLAFAGFLGVVAGVVLPSVLVIAAGATAFALGQTLVTLSFRKGFVAGWALRRGGEPVRKTRRRRAGGGPRKEPALEVTALEYGSDGDSSDTTDTSDISDTSGTSDGPDAAEIYSPQPLPDDTGSYGIQSFAPNAGAGDSASFASPFTTAEQDAHQYAAYYDPQTQGGYDYGNGYPAGEQQVYAAYSDPYIGTGGVSPQQPFYDAGYTPYAGQAPDPYAGAQQQYSMDTPPGGVWVPQQRSTDEYAQPYPGEEQAPYPPQEPQGYPYQGGTGEYEQYRY
ncbi:hypothetical protein MTF65_28680 [Streptomyces sp. APSN-46.1]|uniref:hypothetical protein n=1 Tax=Streptomyces sp. APSN-46.1 TaxID=2929049 RepID=UPI001FB2596A|nr:hypothetical protein [Streptomyces sp. APSN-46.1]MCJ1681259.1 hypothetical protein [Streptomyces sp. APSN-46.1]